jgi:hypothetical protein
LFATEAAYFFAAFLPFFFFFAAMVAILLLRVKLAVGFRCDCCGLLNLVLLGASPPNRKRPWHGGFGVAIEK